MSEQVKCSICGEKTHSKEIPHMTKTDLYKIIAKGLELIDRSFFSSIELADLAASYLGKPIVLVEQRSHKTGIFSRAPATMIHEAQPRPSKFILPNGLVVWRTDSLENMPHSAPEYKIKNMSIKVTAQAACPECGSTIEFDSFKISKVQCSNCKKRYGVVVDDSQLVWQWVTNKFIDSQIQAHLVR